MFDFIFELFWCPKIAKMVSLLILSYRFYVKMTKINLNSISIMNSEHLRITAYICVYLYSLPAANFSKACFRVLTLALALVASLLRYARKTKTTFQQESTGEEKLQKLKFWKIFSRKTIN